MIEVLQGFNGGPRHQGGNNNNHGHAAGYGKDYYASEDCPEKSTTTSTPATTSVPKPTTTLRPTTTTERPSTTTVVEATTSTAVQPNVPTPVDVTTTTAEVAVATPATAVAVDELAYTGVSHGLEIAVATSLMVLGGVARRIAHINR